jgi:hypothetical protein
LSILRIGLFQLTSNLYKQKNLEKEMFLTTSKLNNNNTAKIPLEKVPHSTDRRAGWLDRAAYQLRDHWVPIIREKCRKLAQLAILKH